MINLKNKKVIVTGATSMIGQSTVKALQMRNAEIWPLYHEDVDLLDHQQTKELFEDISPDYCIHLAGYNGNIKFNSEFPADIFFNTTMMGLNVLNACKNSKVKKVVSALSSCGYKAGSEPLEEYEFLNGEPDKSTEAHAYGKRDLLIYSKLLNKQHDLDAVCCVFNTTFGPYDNFDLNKTKVVGSLIKKFVDAVENGDKAVECWGTGNPRREIVFSDDVGEAIVQTLEKYTDHIHPLNIGFNQDYSIKEISEKISKLVGYTGDISWDLTKPDGQFRKILNSSRMKNYDINLAQTPIDEALLKTIQFYKERYK